MLGGIREIFSMEYCWTAAGRPRWFAARVSVLHHNGLKLTMVMHTEVTERVLSERENQRSESRWRAMVQNAPIYILLVDVEGRIQFINRTEGGFKPEDMLGAKVEDMVRPEYVGDVRRALAEVFQHGRSAEVVSSALGPHGEARWYSAVVGPLQGSQPAQAIWIASDITKERALEEQLRQSQKMEAVGRLAGGIAHDFNNLLTVIMGQAELLASTLEDTAQRQRAQQVLNTGKRAAALTQQLLAFSRRQMLQPRRINLNDVAADAAKLLERLIGEDIRFEIALAPDLHTVVADPTQIERALLNLAVNARDAMPQGGTLRIESRNVELNAADLAAHTGRLPGPHVVLSVADTGAGMDAATRARLFEPFFTTKAKGKGTGLGLSTVHGIVAQSGGHIEVRSEVGQGASFNLFFPAEAGPAQTRRPTQTVATATGSERILVVEDDNDVRALACDILMQHGYEVEQAISPDAALALLDGSAPDFKLLLSDVVMPGMNGQQLVEKITARQPKLRVLFMSGYTDDHIVRRGLENESFNFIQKPFSIVQLTTKVREVLDA